MKNFGKKTFFISIAVYILLLIPCYLATFGNDEGTLNPGSPLLFFAWLFNVLRFPTHTLLWPLFSQTSIIYFIGFMINTVLWALVVERILCSAKTKFLGLLLFIFLVPPNTFAQLNPTGTYKMGTGPDDNYNVTNKSRGEIRIKKINNTKIAIALYAIIGYDVADLVDTLTFKNGKAVYQGNRSDSTCRIYFEFSKSKVLVKQTSNEHPSPCGFGWNADASGTYRKQSAKVPIITDLAKEE